MPSSQQNVTNIPSNRVDFIDPKTGLVTREWYRFFVNLFNLSGAGGNQTSLDDLQVGPPPQPATTSGGGGGTGTVTSVDMTVPTGLAVSGNPITTAGTLAVTYASGYAIPTTVKQTQWDTAYTERQQWDGGATNLVAATGRTSLGGTTVGSNLFTLTNPSAITFPQFNADNTVSALTASAFRTAIGAGTGGGSVTSVGTAGTVNGLTLTGGPITTTGTVTLGGTLDLSSPPTIGNTTPNTGSFTTLIGGADVANYGQLTGGATTKAVEFKTLGSDTNVSYAIRSKGTGAIDLAAGSSGVNISNGGTVTALTRTANGTNYTGVPSVAITAPTTAGGVQATATVRVLLNSATVANGGTGYTVGDVLTISGATGPNPNARLNVTAVSGGVITAVTVNATAIMDTVPSNPASFTGGTGSGATFNCLYVIENSFNITNAGSGYVEQPTVSFSGGGGSGAAAYASVGSNVTVKGLAGSMFFATSGGTNFQVSDSGLSSPPAIPFATGGSGSAGFGVTGSATNAGFTFTSKGTSAVDFYTNSYGSLGLKVSHTASAVNYVQVTGAATTANPTISSQGSDTNINLVLNAKGSSSVLLQTAGQNVFQATGSGIVANRLLVTGTATTVAPSLSCVGSDTNIDLALTPKGTGVLKTTAVANIGAGTVLAGATNPLVAMTGNTNQYVQSYIVNNNVGTSASSDFVAYANNSTDSHGWADMGFTSSAYADATYTVTGANEAYLFGSALNSTYTGNLVYATDSTGSANSHQFYVGGFTQAKAAWRMQITSTLLQAKGSLQLMGSSSGYVGLQGAAAAGSTTYTLPSADGTTGQALTTNGSGTLSWSTPSGSSNVTAKGLWENAKTISANYSITSGNSAMSAGPITIASGVTVTVPSGSRWVVL
jgi:hypothetical protein